MDEFCRDDDFKYSMIADNGENWELELFQSVQPVIASLRMRVGKEAGRNSW